MSDRAVRAWAAAIVCLIRHAPRFFAAAPKTPLRVLGIVAFDTLHLHRGARVLPRARVEALAMFLDLEGFANASWDRKTVCEPEYAAVRLRLEQAGLGPLVAAYLRRLQDVESRRPLTGDDESRFEAVRSYREAVARLSIASAAAIALGGEALGRDALGGETVGREALAALPAACGAAGDCDVDTLFRILMQCQIVDDILDYPEDRSAHLPGFLTASPSLPQALAFADTAARTYGAPACDGSGRAAPPLRLALSVMTAAARGVIALAAWQMRHSRHAILHGRA
jgi:hypothetical protein